MFVKNLNGTSGRECPCGTWIKHWKNYIKVSEPVCFYVTCEDPGTEGAHVQKYGGDESWYIIPLCKHHHDKNHGQPIEIKEDCKKYLVPAASRDKCENR